MKEGHEHRSKLSHQCGQRKRMLSTGQGRGLEFGWCVTTPPHEMTPRLAHSNFYSCLPERSSETLPTRGWRDLVSFLHLSPSSHQLVTQPAHLPNPTVCRDSVRGRIAAAGSGSGGIGAESLVSVENHPLEGLEASPTQWQVSWTMEAKLREGVCCS
jgi:hypothetical protein